MWAPRARHSAMRRNCNDPRCSPDHKTRSNLVFILWTGSYFVHFSVYWFCFFCSCRLPWHTLLHLCFVWVMMILQGVSKTIKFHVRFPSDKYAKMMIFRWLRCNLRFYIWMMQVVGGFFSLHKPVFPWIVFVNPLLDTKSASNCFWQSLRSCAFAYSF
jgi:hypothetical protein